MKRKIPKLPGDTATISVITPHFCPLCLLLHHDRGAKYCYQRVCASVCQQRDFYAELAVYFLHRYDVKINIVSDGTKQEKSL